MSGLPWKLTLRHHFDFGPHRTLVGDNLAGPRAWDAIRSAAPPPLGQPRTRADWERVAAAPHLIARGTAIAEFARRRGVRELASHGVGAGYLELNIHRAAPDIDLCCTDFAPATVARLRVVFPEATVRTHDLLSDDPPSADLHLLYRVDKDFSDDQLPRVLARFHEPLLFVPTEPIDLKEIAREVYWRIVKRRTSAPAGWSRTESALRELWSNTHVAESVSIADMHGYLLLRG